MFIGLASGRNASPTNNNANAIRTENLVRRVLGITSQRTGSGHAGGIVQNAQALPTIKN